MRIELKKPLKGYTIIAGFPGIGLVGPITAKHIVDFSKMELAGVAFSKDFPAVTAIRKGISLPPVRIYADEEKKVAVVLSEIMFSEGTAKMVGEALVKIAKDEGVERIISIAGVLIPNESKARILGAGSRDADVEFLRKHGIQPVKKGITTGISATLLTSGQETGTSVVLILGALKAKEDYNTAAEIVKKLDDMLGLGVSCDELAERAKEIEKEVSKIVARSGHQESPMYG